MRFKQVIFVFLLFNLFYTQAQEVEVVGKVKASGDLENIHVLNLSFKKYSTTNSKGVFRMIVRENDTILFKSVKYKDTVVVVSENMIDDEYFEVFLEDQINELDEVIVGKVLTGKLDSDIKNAEVDRPIDFYDVGIPGFKGKPKTQSERRLHEADAGSFVTIGLGIGVNLNKILNRITGRTKKLKERVRVETNDAIIRSVRDRLADDLFAENPLDEEYRNDFFFFCTDDTNFELRCRNKSDIEIYIFLQEKLKEYKANLESKN